MAETTGCFKLELAHCEMTIQPAGKNDIAKANCVLHINWFLEWFPQLYLCKKHIYCYYISSGPIHMELTVHTCPESNLAHFETSVLGPQNDWD